MAVPEQTPYIEYTGNGSTTSFPLTFDCDNADHLIVTINDTDAVVGSWSLNDGNVIFTAPPANDALVVFKRSSPIQRSASYQQYDNSFRPAPVNKDFDKIWVKLQELGVEDWLLWRGLAAETAARIAADIAYDQLSIQRDNALQAYLVNKINEVYTALAIGLSNEITNRINGDNQTSLAAREYIDLMLRMNNSMPIFDGVTDNVVMLPDGRTQRNKNKERISFLDFSDPSKSVAITLPGGDVTATLKTLATMLTADTRVDFSYGNYTVNDEINFNQSGIWLDGQNCTITQLTANKKIFKSTGTTGFRVSGFNLVGKGTEHNGASTSYNGVAAIMLDSCKNARIYDNSIKRFAGGGIRWTGSADNHRIFNNDIEGIGTTGGIVSGDNNGDFAIGAYSSTEDKDLVIFGNTISKHCFGIGLSKGKGCRIISNSIHDIAGQHAMYLSNPSDITVSNNKVRDIAGEGIKIQLASSDIISEDVVITDNTVRNTGGSGILVSSTSVVTNSYFIDPLVSNNKVKNAGSYGINLASVKDATCQNNDIKATGAYGIYLNDGYGKLSGNRIKDAQWTGLYLSITDDTYLTDNDIQDVVLNTAGDISNARYLYYVQAVKNVNATGTPKLFYQDNRLIRKNSAPALFMDVSGRAVRVTTGVDVYHLGKNSNLTSQPHQLTADFVKVFDLGYSPNVDESTTANINPPIPISGFGRRTFYGTQSPQAAASTNTHRQGDICWNATTASGGVIGWVCTVSGAPGTWQPFGIAGATKAVALADSAAADVATLKTNFNTLLANLRTAGLMA